MPSESGDHVVQQQLPFGESRSQPIGSGGLKGDPSKGPQNRSEGGKALRRHTSSTIAMASNLLAMPLLLVASCS